MTTRNRSVPCCREESVSVHQDPKRKARPFVVRWRETGRQRNKAFATEQEAIAFDRSRSEAGATTGAPLNELEALRLQLAQLEARIGSTPPEPADDPKRGGDGVYEYSTRSGVRYRFAFRQADGRLSNRRGFTSRTAARRAKRELEESVRRGEVSAARDTFDAFWREFLASRKPYLTPGAYDDYETHGRKRLLPFFTGHRVAEFDEALVRAWLAGFLEDVDDGKLSAKTVNNARTCLSVALNEAVARGALIPGLHLNFCAHFPWNCRFYKSRVMKCVYAVVVTRIGGKLTRRNVATSCFFVWVGWP